LGLRLNDLAVHMISFAPASGSVVPGPGHLCLIKF
jgi:hypothetical protein